MIDAKPASMNVAVYDKLTVHVAPESDTNSVIQACNKATTEKEVRDTFDKFCQSKRLAGTKVVFASTESLGHIKPKRALAERVAFVLKQDIHTVEQYLDALSGAGTLTQQNDAKQWFSHEIESEKGNPSLNLTHTPMWLFRSDDTSRGPFVGEIACLPWRLGLPNWKAIGPAPAIACYGFEFSARSTPPCYLPTAFDGNYDWTAEFWMPYGKTQPLSSAPDRCQSAGGLQEVVTTPIHLGATPYPFKAFDSAT